MSAPFTYGKPTDDREVAAFHHILTQSFGVPPDASRSPGLEEGVANLRLVRRTGRVVGGLAIQPCGQYFGGRSVPMGGVRIVGIAPDVRGAGAGRFLMDACVREHRERGWAISTLFPSTRALYRRSGYEVAGAWPTWRLPLNGEGADENREEKGLTLRAFDLGDAAAMAAIRKLYDLHARRAEGHLDRSDWYWARVFRQIAGDGAGNLVYAYLLEGPAGPEGYVIYTQPSGGSRRYRLKVRDWVAATPAARRRLLGFFAAHRTLADQVELHAAPNDPLLVAGEEPRMTPAVDHPWMLRIADVQAALEARGWPAGFACELRIAVQDPLVPENERPIVLTIEAGRAAVRLGANSTIHVDIRGLAAMYSGYLDPHAVRGLGLLDASDADLALLRTAFAGPTPWLPEIF